MDYCFYKKAFQKSERLFCTRNKARTCTSLRILVPETSASTNSAIRANLACLLVPRTRLELAHPFEYHPLKVACLPISPPGPILFCKSTKTTGIMKTILIIIELLLYFILIYRTLY